MLRLNYNIQKISLRTWKTDITKLWRAIKGNYGTAKLEAENQAITVTGSSFSSSNQLANKFNRRHKAGQTPISDKGDKEEIPGDGTNIHHDQYL